MAVWFMKTVFTDTWITGARYLSSTDVTTDMTAFVQKCANYLEVSGTLKSSPIVFTIGDTAASIVGNAGIMLNSMAIAFASR